ncbi:hypothetical protein [Labrenzia sp. DG1229]|uniref:hypothetical protein n=1 Tax=Labrenzia sp. DG1229 TaxID=681847 RepID=UPI001AD90703|nr:hypothetical protein [Labrenzia sp. DG1229]
MRVNPVSATGRAIVRHRRPSSGDARSERQADLAVQLPPPSEQTFEREQETLFTHYHPNSVFLAHLIATSDVDLQIRGRRKTVPEICSDAYRATASLPRKRSAGHLIKTDR